MNTPPAAPAPERALFDLFRSCLTLCICGWILCAAWQYFTKPAAPAAPSGSLQLLGARFERYDLNGRDQEIIASVKNAGLSECRYAAVQFRLLNAQGEQVGSAMQNTTNLKAGAIWRIRCPVYERGAERIEVAELTCN